jgi:hypothetical protein
MRRPLPHDAGGKDENQKAEEQDKRQKTAKQEVSRRDAETQGSKKKGGLLRSGPIIPCVLCVLCGRIKKKALGPQRAQSTQRNARKPSG